MAVWKIAQRDTCATALASLTIEHCVNTTQHTAKRKIKNNSVHDAYRAINKLKKPNKKRMANAYKLHGIPKTREKNERNTVHKKSVMQTKKNDRKIMHVRVKRVCNNIEVKRRNLTENCRKYKSSYVDRYK